MQVDNDDDIIRTTVFIQIIRHCISERASDLTAYLNVYKNYFGSNVFEFLYDGLSQG